MAKAAVNETVNKCPSLIAMRQKHKEGHDGAKLTGKWPNVKRNEDPGYKGDVGRARDAVQQTYESLYYKG